VYIQLHQLSLMSAKNCTGITVTIIIFSYCKSIHERHDSLGDRGSMKCRGEESRMTLGG
ncbi:Hypothetical protein FKW44_015928, partial [Caligus rogercresseyi]